MTTIARGKGWPMRWRRSLSRSGGLVMPPGGRIGWREFAWLALSSVLVAAGLLMVYSAKTQSFPELSAALGRGDLLDLNGVSKPEQLLPFLQVFQDAAEREQVADKIFEYVS